MATAAAVAAPAKRRGALTTASRHWTDALAESEHATTRLGAKFHLRKLFLRADVDEFSQSELAFIVQYLVNETTISEQPWWAALTEYEQLEVVNMLELNHVPKGETVTLWFSSREASKDCVLLYGTAEAKPVDRNAAPVLRFPEGSVVGNMRLSTAPLADGPSADATALSPVSSMAISAHASPETWRRIKREQTFRNGPNQYNKLTITGPADYFVLTSSQIQQTTGKAAERLEREQLLQMYGLERFVGCIRRKTFECGAILAKEDELMPALYFIIEGECRASVRVDQLNELDPFAEKSVSNGAADTLLSVHRATTSPRRPTQLPIASLGPRSLVGDVSVLLGLREPATIQAVTAVAVLSLAYEDFAKEVSELREPSAAAPIERMKKVALDTLGFVLDRVVAEAAYNQCDQHKTIAKLKTAIAEKTPELETPLARRVLGGDGYVQPARYQTLSLVHDSNDRVHRKASRLLSSPSTQSPRLADAARIPSVVQKYKETLASKNLRSCKEGSLAPIVLSKRSHKAAYDPADERDCPTSMTREQRKAAFALSGLHSPLAAKSLGQLQYGTALARRRNHRDEEDDELFEGNRVTPDPSNAKPTSPTTPSIHHRVAIDDHLFLFPTMTRQRQLHARSLPLLPKYRGPNFHSR